ncbi:MAG: sulfatase-like hydrolase/transferase [Planctomycetia bacterium]|nr:sulfatase-like hydrolase/transferase [Planctomycetia bacterium]
MLNHPLITSVLWHFIAMCLVLVSSGRTIFAELLHDAGYVTGTIGKWHLGGSGFEPTRQGFDSNVGGDHAGSPLSYFAP